MSLQRKVRTGLKLLAAGSASFLIYQIARESGPHLSDFHDVSFDFLSRHTPISAQEVSEPIPSVFPVPDDYTADYSIPPPPNSACEDFFTSKFFEDTAQRHASYCDRNGSRSNLECFDTKGRGVMCLARGVEVTKRYESPQLAHLPPMVPILHCKIRNFTAELLGNATADVIEEVTDMPKIEDMQGNAWGNGIQGQLQYWNVTDETNGARFSRNSTSGINTTCTAQQNDGTVNLMIRRDININLWHQLGELLNNIATLDILQMAVNKSSSGPYLSKEGRGSVQPIFFDNNQLAFDEVWEILSGKPPIRLANMAESCLGSVVMPLTGENSVVWGNIWEPSACYERFLLDPFMHKVFRHFNITPRGYRVKEDPLVISIVERTTNRKIYNLHKYAQIVRDRYPDAKVNVVDWSGMTLYDQIMVAQNTTILVGVLGQGLTQLLFLPPEGVLAEITSLPASELSYSGFRNIAKMRTLHYVSVHPEEGVNMTQIILDDERAQREAEAPTQTTSVVSSDFPDQTAVAEQPPDLNGAVVDVTTDAAESGSPRNDLHVRPGVQTVEALSKTQASDATETASTESSPQRQKVKRGHWQLTEWVYVTEEKFMALIDAAINAQAHAGYTNNDVVMPYHPKPKKAS